MQVHCRVPMTPSDNILPKFRHSFVLSVVSQGQINPQQLLIRIAHHLHDCLDYLLTLPSPNDPMHPQPHCQHKLRDWWCHRQSFQLVHFSPCMLTMLIEWLVCRKFGLSFASLKLSRSSRRELEWSVRVRLWGVLLLRSTHRPPRGAAPGLTFELLRFENLKKIIETQSSRCFVVVSFPGPLLLPNKYSYLLTILPL